MEKLQQEWETYERKIKDKDKVITKYADKLNLIETEHLGCIKRQLNDKLKIEDLEKWVQKDTMKVLEQKLMTDQLKADKAKLRDRLQAEKELTADLREKVESIEKRKAAE